MKVQLDHCVIHVPNWAISNAFYRDVLGAEIVPRGAGFMYCFGHQQLNLHGPGLTPTPLARVPVQPGNSDLCFVWGDSIQDAIEHLDRHGVPVELGPVPASARGARAPACISVTRTARCLNSSSMPE